MNNLVIMKNQEAVTSSLQVAEVFGKEHKVVLKAIDELKEGWHKIMPTYFTKIPTFIHKTNNLIAKLS